MGNSNCTKCLQDCDVSKEIDLKPSIILRAYGNTRNSNSFDTIARRPIRPEKPSSLYASAQEVECIIKLQSAWRSYTCQKQFSLVRRLICQNHIYFSQEELRCTLSRSPINLSSPAKLKSQEFKYPSGGLYKGEWLGGFRHGSGTMTWPDQASYSGSFSFGYASGFGVFCLPSKSETYRGQFTSPYIGCSNPPSTPRSALSLKSSCKDGYLWLYLLHGDKPEAVRKVPDFRDEFKKNMAKIQARLEAQDLIIKETENELKAEFQEFCQSHQVLSLDSHNRFWGQMKENKREGLGVNEWENGDKYSGQWKNDLQHGRGWNLWVDGSWYVGTYANGLKDGLGEYVWEDGTRYSGGWKENSIDGVGKYVWSDGREYSGEWKDGHMHGFGELRAKDKKVYQCKWLNGKKHGPGYVVLKDGKVVSEVWENGKPGKKTCSTNLN